MTREEILERCLAFLLADIEYSNARIEGLRAKIEGNTALVDRWAKEEARRRDLRHECLAATVGISPNMAAGLLDEDEELAWQDWWVTMGCRRNVQDWLLEQLTRLEREGASLADAFVAGTSVKGGWVMYRALHDRARAELDQICARIEA